MRCVELRGLASVTQLSVDAEYGAKQRAFQALSEKAPLGDSVLLCFVVAGCVSRISHAYSPAAGHVLGALLAWPAGRSILR